MENEEEKKQKSEQLLDQELDEKELDSVSGGWSWCVSVKDVCYETKASSPYCIGPQTACASTYKDGENCLANDQCNHAFFFYPNSESSEKNCWVYSQM